MEASCTHLMVSITTLLLIVTASSTGHDDEGCRNVLPYLGELCSMLPGPKVRPSQACCDFVKGLDVVCACHNLQPSDGDKSAGEKLPHVADYCGNPLPPGSQCGSKHHYRQHLSSQLYIIYTFINLLIFFPRCFSISLQA
ncbi:hypothetical protein NMG60_11023464 [Bertholletia excelsa]